MKRKKLLGGILVLCMAASLAGCGSKADYSSYNFEPYEMKDSYDSEVYNEGFALDNSLYSEAGDSNSLQSDSIADTSRKLIKNYSLDVETEVFDEFMASLDARVKTLRGYFESINTYNGNLNSKSGRNSSMVIRVPALKVDEFVDFVGDSANVTNKYLNVEDVTLSYVDVEAKKKTYEIELERLLSMLEKVETVEDMITFESRISEVRYKLETQESQLRTYDNLVDYATVVVSVKEVVKYTPPEPESYGEKVSRSFKNGLTGVIEGLKNFFINFVGALPSLVLFAILALIVVFIIKGVKKHNKKKLANAFSDDAVARMNEAKTKAKEKANSNE